MRPVTVVFPDNSTWKTRKPNQVSFYYSNSDIRIPRGYRIDTISNRPDRVIVNVVPK